MLKLKVVNSNYFHFHFHFYFLLDLFSFILFLELELREVVSIDHKVLVYKVDYPIQSSLLSSLVLTQYKIYSFDQL